MNLLDIVLYFGAAALASTINSVAGGGTFITFPVLMLGGLSAIQANITSTIALWPGAITSALTYKSSHEYDKKKLIPLMVISVIGGTIGTLVLLATPEVIFSMQVPWLLLAATLIFTFGRYIQPPQAKGPLAGVLLQFIIAMYGGYFGAGIGILMLAMLQISGFTNIHQMNGMKSLLGSTINAVAVLVFAFSGKVVWDVALVMAAGAMCGGYFGTRVALRVAPNKMRLLVSVVGFSMTAYFFLYGV